MKKRLAKSPTLTATKLKQKMSELADVSIRSIQRSCLKELNLPSRNISNKLLLTERMMQQRLDFAN
jgi:hypothetical protein